PSTHAIDRVHSCRRRRVRFNRPPTKGHAVYLLDDHVVLTPDDLAQCEFALLRHVAQLRDLLPPIEGHVFMGERAAALTAEHRARVVEEYRRKYSRMFTHLDAPRGDSLAALRARHRETIDELRSLR